MKRKINFEEDNLVIYRNNMGNFSYFRWYSSSHTPERLQELCEKWNKDQEGKPVPQTAELITDRLIKEICAYAEYSMPLEVLLEEMEEITEDIERARDNLNSAIHDLNRIFEEHG